MDQEMDSAAERQKPRPRRAVDFVHAAQTSSPVGVPIARCMSPIAAVGLTYFLPLDFSIKERFFAVPGLARTHQTFGKQAGEHVSRMTRREFATRLDLTQSI
jgi:hypothetical protein